MPVAAKAPSAPRKSTASGQARGAVTSDRILRSALRLMADSGYNGVSLRQIGLEAGVNLALMNYHFGSKARLLQALFERWGSGINAERLRQLDDLQAQYPKGDPPLEDLLHAFISPTLTASKTEREDELHFIRLSGRLATDPTPEVRQAIAGVYDSSAVKFARMLRDACPHLCAEEFLQRLIFLYGAMVYTRSQTGRVDSLADKLGMKMPKTSVSDAGRFLVPFLAEGIRAPAADQKVTRKARHALKPVIPANAGIRADGRSAPLGTGLDPSFRWGDGRRRLAGSRANRSAASTSAATPAGRR